MAYPINTSLKALEGVTIKVETVESPLYIAKDSDGKTSAYKLYYEDYTKKDGTQTKIAKYFKLIRNADKTVTEKPLELSEGTFDEKRAFSDKLRQEVFNIKKKSYTFIGNSNKKITAQQNDPNKKAFEGYYIKFNISAMSVQNLLEGLIPESKLPAKNEKGFRPYGWEEAFIDDLSGAFVEGVKNGEYVNLVKGKAFEAPKTEQSTTVKEAPSEEAKKAINDLPF